MPITAGKIKKRLHEEVRQGYYGYEGAQADAAGLQKIHGGVWIRKQDKRNLLVIAAQQLLGLKPIDAEEKKMRLSILANFLNPAAAQDAEETSLEETALAHSDEALERIALHTAWSIMDTLPFDEQQIAKLTKALIEQFDQLHAEELEANSQAGGQEIQFVRFQYRSSQQSLAAQAPMPPAAALPEAQWSEEALMKQSAASTEAKKDKRAVLFTRLRQMPVLKTIVGQLEQRGIMRDTAELWERYRKELARGNNPLDFEHNHRAGSLVLTLTRAVENLKQDFSAEDQWLRVRNILENGDINSRRALAYAYYVVLEGELKERPLENYKNIEQIDKVFLHEIFSMENISKNMDFLESVAAQASSRATKYAAVNPPLTLSMHPAGQVHYEKNRQRAEIALHR